MSDLHEHEFDYDEPSHRAPSSRDRRPVPQVIAAEARAGTRAEFDRLRQRIRRGDVPWPRIHILPRLDGAGVKSLRRVLEDEVQTPGDAVRLLLGVEADDPHHVIGLDDAEVAASSSRLQAVLQEHVGKTGASIKVEAVSFGFLPDEERRYLLDGPADDVEAGGEDGEPVVDTVLLVTLSAEKPTEDGAGTSLAR